MNPLVDGKLIELCFSAKQKDVYFSKTTVGPSGWAFEDGFRPAKFPLCTWLCHFVILRLTFTQQRTLDSDLPLQGFGDTLLLPSCISLATLK